MPGLDMGVCDCGTAWPYTRYSIKINIVVVPYLDVCNPVLSIALPYLDVCLTHGQSTVKNCTSLHDYTFLLVWECLERMLWKGGGFFQWFSISDYMYEHGILGSQIHLRFVITHTHARTHITQELLATGSVLWPTGYSCLGSGSTGFTTKVVRWPQRKPPWSSWSPTPPSSTHSWLPFSAFQRLWHART